METSRLTAGTAPDSGGLQLPAEDARIQLAAAAADVCELTRAPFCAISKVRGDRAVVVGVQGGRSQNAPPPGTYWRVADIPPAHQALAGGRTVTVTGAQDPRLPAPLREQLLGEARLLATAFVPLLHHGAPRGLLVLADTHERDLAPLVPGFGAVCRLAAAVLAQDERLAELSHVADDLALVLDDRLQPQPAPGEPSPVLRAVAHRLADLTGAPVTTVHIHDGDALRCVASWRDGAFREEDPGGAADFTSSPLLRAALVSGRIESVANLADPRLDATTASRLSEAGVQSLLFVPLMSRGRAIGVMQALFTSPHDPSAVLQEAADLGGVAAQVLEKTLLSNTIALRDRFLREIAELGRGVAQGTAPEQVARSAANLLLAVFDARRCDVFRFSDEGTALVTRAASDARGLNEVPALNETAPLCPSPGAGGEPVVVASPDEPGLAPEVRETLRRRGLAGMLSIPLVNGERLLGQIEVSDDRPRGYREHLDTARTISQVVEAAFAQAALREALAASDQELRLLVESALESGAAARPDDELALVAHRIRRLAEASACDLFAVEDGLLRMLTCSDDGTVGARFAGTAYRLVDMNGARRAADAGRPMSVADVDTDVLLSEYERAEHRRCGFRALLELPLVAGGEVVGLALVADRRPRAFAHIDALRGFGQIAAQAIVSARIRRELDTAAERLMLSSEVAVDLASSLDVPRTVDAAARHLCVAAGVDTCDIYRLENDQLRHLAGVCGGRRQRGATPLRRLSDWRTAELAIESRSPIRVAAIDGGTPAPGEHEAASRSGRRGELLAPLVAESRVIGLAVLTDSLRERGFTSDELATVEVVCRLGALTIQNADSFTDLQARHREAELVNRIAVRTGARLETGAVAVAAVEELAGFLPFTDALLLMGSGDVWEVVHSSSGGRAGLSEVACREMQTFVRAHLADQAAALVDLGAAPGLVRMRLELEPVRSLLLVVVWDDDECRGVLALGAPSPEAFSEADRLLMVRVGAQLSLSFKNARLYEDVKSMHASSLRALTSALNARDTYALGHGTRVAVYMLLLGRELGWPDDELTEVVEASLLHDVGRIGIADDVLMKPGRLSDRDAERVREQTRAGAQILRPLFREDLVAAVRHHHERWDGSGYPDGLAGDQIPEKARALCIVNSYDAMSSRRPHHRALTYSECLAELEHCRGTQFDPNMVPAFMRVLDRLDERRSVARAAAAEAAAHLDLAAVRELIRSRDEDGPSYRELAGRLREARDAHPDVRYLTTLVAGREGWEMLCDPEEDPLLRSHIGEAVDVGDGDIPSVTDTAARNVLDLDDFGIWVCGVADVRDANGDVIAVTCADVPPSNDWPADLAARVTGHDQPFSVAVESAAARLGRAQVDAITDPLTGLYNRRFFRQRLGEELERATDVHAPLTLLFCDLDRFKEFNDRFGHVAGDQALEAVSRVVRDSIRHVDIASRYGGEEFAVILLETAPQRATDVAERIRAGVSSIDLGDGPGSLTISLGIAGFPADAKHAEELVDKADWAMYLAKRHGRDRVMAFGSREDGEAQTTG